MKVVILLVKGFETIEATTTIDLLRRADINLDVVSVFDDEYVTSAQNVKIIVDKKLSDIDLKKYDFMILPGGSGTDNYYNSSVLMDNIKYFYENNKYIAAICAAPTVLANNNILIGQDAVAYPSCINTLLENGANIIDEKVVSSKNIITSKSAGTSIEFALKIIETIKGIDIRNKIAKSIVY